MSISPFTLISSLYAGTTTPPAASVRDVSPRATEPSHPCTKSLIIRIIGLFIVSFCYVTIKDRLIKTLRRSLTNNLANGSNIQCRQKDANQSVSHSTSLPCLIKNGNGEPSSEAQPINDQAADRQLTPHRSMSLSTLQPFHVITFKIPFKITR